MSSFLQVRVAFRNYSRKSLEQGRCTLGERGSEQGMGIKQTGHAKIHRSWSDAPTGAEKTG